MSVDNSGTNPHDVATDATHTQPSDAATTDGTGPEMAIWSDDRRDQLLTLTVGTYTNNSSYSLPAGIVDSAARSHDVGFQQTTGELTLTSPGADPTSGDAPLMQVWYADRRTRLTTLTAGTFTNYSSFALPAAVVDSDARQHDVGFQAANGEQYMGHAIPGQALAPNGVPLEGSVVVRADGEDFAADSVSGTFIASIKPPTAVTDGADGPGLPTFTAEFVPKFDGIGATVDPLGYPEASFFNVTYGYIAGQVFDYLGEPVENVVVQAEGASTSTDEDGVYALLAPEASAVDLTSLNGTRTKQANAIGGQTVEVDFTFGAVKVKVLGPELRPIESAPVQIGETQYKTDSTGTVLVEQKELGEHELTVFDSFTDTVSVLGEGQLAKYTYEGGARFTIKCFDGVTGDAIVDLPGLDTENQALSFSSDSGEVSILAPSNSAFDVRLGWQDKRYRNQSVQVELDDGETATQEAVLDRKTAIRNS